MTRVDRIEWLQDDVETARAAVDSLERAPMEGRWCGDERGYRIQLDRRLADLRMAEQALERFLTREKAVLEGELR